ncbi:MAG: hypothetical protein LBL70_02415 [Treponema sp.]|jgi:hypothetical protein|nr:hypothetical protein [Treponema sp.]
MRVKAILGCIMSLLFSSCWTINEQAYTLSDEDKSKIYIEPYFKTSFDISPTRYIVIMRKVIGPYNFNIFLGEYHKKYKTVTFDNITLLFNQTQINLLELIESINISENKNGEDEHLNGAGLQEFFHNKTIYLLHDKYAQTIGIHFKDLDIKYDKVKYFQIRIKMLLEDIEGNIIEVDRYFKFVQTARKISIIPTV